VVGVHRDDCVVCGCGGEERGGGDVCVVLESVEETDDFFCAGCHFCKLLCGRLHMRVGTLEGGCEG
jgi:hypothetical protein